MLTWVVYDISDNKKRFNAANRCKKFGLYRVQKSCFLGELSRNQRDSLVLELRETLDQGDSIFVFPTCDNCVKEIELLGEGFDMELVRSQIGTLIL